MVFRPSPRLTLAHSLLKNDGFRRAFGTRARSKIAPSRSRLSNCSSFPASGRQTGCLYSLPVHTGCHQLVAVIIPRGNPDLGWRLCQCTPVGTLRPLGSTRTWVAPPQAVVRPSKDKRAARSRRPHRELYWYGEYKPEATACGRGLRRGFRFAFAAARCRADLQIRLPSLMVQAPQ